MKRTTRTTITWRFENPMAPHSHNYLPCPKINAELVMVTAVLFRGQAHLSAWFRTSEHLLRYFLTTNEIGHEVRRRLGLVTIPGKNGDAANVSFSFQLESGTDFTHAACQKFIDLCDIVGDKEYRKCYFLPYPEISQVTMVEAYGEDNWVPYGEYVWEKDFAPKADAEAMKLLETPR